ncbi:hypothetical protein FUA48_11110 [Flavobacterium alkalisoli]|uniref:Uncharacterized protein n=1 Tax=Flavobacterium alkalisoli TaxID=2602769 RepID=A0A5B9FWG5_9FLAO|nr:hypothetical protein [Flavobacterium alkalisoli]QEE50108.1 hypothetical protein FUA48_11110 [Flavobacterium alkalisoli]
MSLLLYINGQLIDLDAGQYIAQTKQVNDLNSLDDRQASYTNKFKLPKTANNIRAMDQMTLSGNLSNVPYQKNTCSLFNDVGECFVYNGWAVITDGGDYYEAVVYDGIINLFKEVEKDTLASIGLDELTHEKTPETVAQSWTQDLPYRYILADYNGKRIYSRGALSFPDRINIDYMVPSINVAWLWGKIFSHYGFTYSGSVFESDEFKNLWLTYPKGLENSGEVIFQSVPDKWHWLKRYKAEWKTYSVSFYDAEINELGGDQPEDNVRYLTAPEAGNYRLTVKGKLAVSTKVNLVVCKNANDYGTFLNPEYIPIPDFFTLKENINSQEEFTVSKNFRLEENDSICLVFRNPSDKFFFWYTPSLNVTLTKLTIGEMNFSNALADFSIKDFIKEIVYRFGLTLFKDKYTNNYEFLSLTEQLKTPAVVDWSNKFAKKLNESYIYGSYAQQNWFRYKYNTEGAFHNDHYITVNNQNLAESKDSINSKIYSPEQQLSLLDAPTNIYKLWEKEVVEEPENDEPPVTYKALDKRFYLMRANLRAGTVRAVSSALASTALASRYYRESFTKLSFSDIINTYYTPLQSILEKALIVNAELYLTDSDISNFDFKKLYYIDALSSYFMVNKINNYIPGRLTKCELVRVNYTPIQREYNVVPTIRLNTINIHNVVQLAPLNYVINYETNFTPVSNLVYQYSPDGVNWKTAQVQQSPRQPDTVITPVPATHFRVRYEATRTLSNTFILD